MRILRSADYRRMPWKNGGGETVEIAVHPAGSSLDEFDWRVSMARVAADGPFSAFPGVERTLAVLDGNGIRLEVGGGAPVELTSSSKPFAFAADVNVEAKLVDGPITDLNVMTRRGRARHSLRCLRARDAVERTVNAAAVLLFCNEGSVEIEAEGAVRRLSAHDTLLDVNVSGTWRIAPKISPVLFLVEIDAPA
jgi:environmental stress-induced protein Ves